MDGGWVVGVRKGLSGIVVCARRVATVYFAPEGVLRSEMGDRMVDLERI